MQKTFFSFLLSTTVVFAGEKFDPPSLSHPLNTLSSQVTSLREPGESTSLPSAPPPKKQKREEYLFLSEDVIGYIASFLPITDGMRMSHTCKSWEKALNSSSIWDIYAKRLPGYSFFNNNPLYLAHNVKLSGKSLFMRLLTPAIIFNPEPDVTFTHMSNDATVMVGYQTFYRIKTVFSKEDLPVDYIQYHTPQSFPTLIKLPVTQALVWRKGQKFPGFLPTFNEEPFSQPTGISKDGKVIIGQIRSQHSGNSYAVKWTNGEVQRLEPLMAGGSTEAKSISADGTVIIGSASQKGVKWTSKGIQLLETPPTYHESAVKAVNADGTVIVGELISHMGLKVLDASKWAPTGATPLQRLMNPEEEELFFPDSGATAINAAGTVIGGYSLGKKDEEETMDIYLTKWAENGVQRLNPDLPGYGKVISISDNGNILIAHHEPFERSEIEGYLLFIGDDPREIKLESYFTHLIGEENFINKIYSVNIEEGIFMGDLYIEEEDNTRNFIGFFPRNDLLKKEGLKSPYFP